MLFEEICRICPTILYKRPEFMCELSVRTLWEAVLGLLRKLSIVVKEVITSLTSLRKFICYNIESHEMLI